MTLQHFVWLGAKRAQKQGVIEKGWRLDLAARMRLPVPNGGILLDNFYWLARQEQVIVLTNGRVQAPQPTQLYDLLYHQVHFPKLDTACAVRPLFDPDPAQTPSRLQVAVTDATALADALCALWTAVLPQEEQTAHTLLIQEMVPLVTEGTAVSLADTAVDQMMVGQQSWEMAKLGGWQRSSSHLPDYGQRLQMLLRGLRRSLGKGNWQVRWGDDGRVCWLLQIQAV